MDFDRPTQCYVAGQRKCLPVINATNYKIQFTDKYSFERAVDYYANYKGWNSRSDVVHIASKTKNPEPEPGVDNDTHSLKINRPEHTQSITKEVITSESRLSVLISVLNDIIIDKVEKATTSINDLTPLANNIEVVSTDKDSPAIVDTTYDVQFTDKRSLERAIYYYANYKGWNSRSDVVHIASKTKDPEPESGVDNDTHSLKINRPEQKKVQSITSFSGARQDVKSVSFDTNVIGKSSLHVPSISSCSSKDLYNHNITSTRIRSFHENTMPSTSKSVHSPDSDVNGRLFCDETIPDSPTSTSEEQNNQEERITATVSTGMTSLQLQAMILAEMDKCRFKHKKVMKQYDIVKKRSQKIKKRKRKMAKATTTI